MVGLWGLLRMLRMWGRLTMDMLIAVRGTKEMYSEFHKRSRTSKGRVDVVGSVTSFVVGE
jgi:hypothetical protein